MHSQCYVHGVLGALGFVYLVRCWWTMLTKQAFYRLKRDNAPATGATRAYREPQSRIFETEAPQFVGAGEGTDKLDFLADLRALKVIDPDSVSKAIPPGDAPVPKKPISSSRTVEAGERSLLSLCLVP